MLKLNQDFVGVVQQKSNHMKRRSYIENTSNNRISLDLPST